MSLAAAWLSQKVHRAYVAEFCRQLLSGASRNALNLIATLVLEFPTLLAIVPPTVDGFHGLVVMTLHRVKTFAGSQVGKFLEMCDRSVREICQKCDGVAKEVRLLDGANGASAQQLADLFDIEITPDSLTAFVMFARHSRCPDGTFLPVETRRRIIAALGEEKEMQSCEVSAPDTDPAAMTTLAELLEKNRILQMTPLVPSPVV
jgi:hypothetical protein